MSGGLFSFDRYRCAVKCDRPGVIAAFQGYFALLWRANAKLGDTLDVVAAHRVGGAGGALSPSFLRNSPSTASPTVCCSAILRSWASNSPPWRVPSFRERHADVRVAEAREPGISASRIRVGRVDRP